MKAKPYFFEHGKGYTPCEVENATHVFLNMPGPIPDRIIPVILKGKRAGTGCWSWNGDTEKPTLKPSIATREYEGVTIKVKCHTWVNDGMVQFLADCTHELAGQTHPLNEVED